MISGMVFSIVIGVGASIYGTGRPVLSPLPVGICPVRLPTTTAQNLNITTAWLNDTSTTATWHSATMTTWDNITMAPAAWHNTTNAGIVTNVMYGSKYGLRDLTMTQRIGIRKLGTKTQQR